MFHFHFRNRSSIHCANSVSSWLKTVMQVFWQFTEVWMKAPFGIRRSVTGWSVPHVQKDNIAFIFKALDVREDNSLEDECRVFLPNVANWYPSTVAHVLEERSPGNFYSVEEYAYVDDPRLNNSVLKRSLKFNQQDATLYNILYCCQCSTCFRRFLRPSSGAQKLYTQHRVYVKLACC